jgi:hypothetical protein
VTEVLLFSTVADGSRAARIHSSSCQLVAAARRSRNGKTRVIDADLDAVVADLNERGYPVKRCKCLGGAK